jgi:hypothetical protein
MIQILYNYLYPDTLAKLYYLENDPYYIQLCEKQLDRKLHTLKNYKNITLDFHNLRIKFNVHFRNLYITSIEYFFDAIDAFEFAPLSKINELPKDFIEYYDHLGIHIKKSKNFKFTMYTVNSRIIHKNTNVKISYYDKDLPNIINIL